MMLSLGFLWMITELLHAKKKSEDKKGLSVVSVLQKIDTASVLFFLGILMAVAALQEVGHLAQVAMFLDEDKQNLKCYSINFAENGMFWQFLAYCAGTGGSALIIGSAAGVAVMGLEKISFGWYIKKISLYAIVGYFAGALTYYLMNAL